MQIQRRTFLSSLTAAFAGCFGLVSAAKASTSKPLADYAELACGPIYKHAIVEWPLKNGLVLWKGKNLFGQTVQLWRIPCDLVRGIPGRKGLIGAYEIRKFFAGMHGDPIILAPSELIAIPGPLTNAQMSHIIDHFTDALDCVFCDQPFCDIFPCSLPRNVG